MTRERRIFLGAIVAFFAVFFFISYRCLLQPPFFDEMWKMDVAFSPKNLDLHDRNTTPIAIGWLFIQTILFTFAGDNVAIARVETAAWAAAAAGIAGLCYLEPTKKASYLAMGAAFGVALALPVQVVVKDYNPYGFDMFYASVLVAVACLWNRLSSSRRFVGLCALTATPLFSIGALFFIPCTALALVWQARRDRWRYAIILATVSATALTIVVQEVFYKPVMSSSTLTNWWAQFIVNASPNRYVDRVVALPRELAQSMQPFLLLPAEPLWLALVALSIIGFACLWRANRFAFLVQIGAIVTVCVAAFFIPWPLLTTKYMGRMNLAWTWIVYASVGAGLAQTLSYVRRFVSIPDRLAVPLLFILLFPLQAPLAVGGVSPFRQLYDDLKTIPLEADGTQIVASAHPLSWWYADFYFTRTRPDTFVVVAEKSDEDFNNAIIRAVREHPKTHDLWLILPFEALQAAVDRARALHVPGFSKVSSQRLQEAEIWRYQR